MATQTFHGSCHCGTLRYEAELDLAAGTGKCNCSYCWKTRNWSIGIKPEQFRWIAGEQDAGRYGFAPDSKNAHVFCKRCGIRIGTTGYVAAREGLVRPGIAAPAAVAAPILIGLGRLVRERHLASDTVGGWLAGTAIAAGLAGGYELARESVAT